MDNIILAIETSIKAGSLALLNNADVIGSWTGNNDVSRSEDLIPQIGLLLERHQIESGSIQKIAVSVGPGSFTGIRVGIAVAKGLAFALERQLVGVSIFEAIAFANLSKTEKDAQKKTVIVSAGRDLYFWQSFQGAVAGDDGVIGDQLFLESRLNDYETSMILAEQNAFESLFRNNFEFLSKTQTVNDNYAELVGKCAVDKSGKPEDVLPLYIRPAVVIKK
jgi:tRNA threonylcarbamoyl adenosine modification protein YeaZ